LRDLATAKTNFEASLRALDSKQLTPPRSEEELMKVAGRFQEISGLPAFVRKGSKIGVSDISTFDFSVLGEAICSFCRGLDQLLVIIDLDRLRHRAFETLACYSAAYQFVDSILSIHGIHFIYRPLARWRVGKERVKIHRRKAEVISFRRKYFEIPFVLGETDRTTWKFSRATASHELRWEKFGEFLIALIGRRKSSEIPIEVRKMYGYLRMVDEFRRHRFEDKVFTDKIEGDGAMKSAISKYGRSIAEIRHKAVYQNQSYDLLTYYALQTKQDLKDFVKVRIDAVKGFAMGLARWNSEMISSIFQHLLGMKPGPRKQTDWLEVACQYIPLDVDLSQVRLEKISRKKEISLINPEIPNIATDILASFASLKVGGRKVFPRIEESC
jgi:hypothetical protein